MKTDELIKMLSTNVEPVKAGSLRMTLVAALVLGGAFAFCLMLATVGLRSDVKTGMLPGFVVLKLLFTLILISAGTALLVKLIRPGQDGRISYAVIFLAFLALGLAGAAALLIHPSAAWGNMVMGTDWTMCVLCIPLFATMPFVGLMWALRKGAPTNLRRTGAIAGLVAGALGAVAYAFHCPDDSIPFIAIWYGVMVGICALIGAILGPRFLRW
jgi:hypothetical protein